MALRIPEGMTPKIDGRLDDEIWHRAAVSGDFVQREPHYGQPASEKTEFRIMYDDRKIYFGVWLWDGDPSGIIGNEMKRDSSLRRGDQLKIIIDTFHDHRNGFYFRPNPLAALKDANTVENGRTINYPGSDLYIVYNEGRRQAWGRAGVAPATARSR